MVKKVKNLPHIIKGDFKRDKRGTVYFVNGFSFTQVKRFYTVENSNKGQVRAWHGHKNEAKYVYAVSGEALVGVAAVDNWDNPSRKSKVSSFKLSSRTPQILYIPKGYANGFKSLTKNAKLIFFSTSTLEESLKDDIRFDPKYWDIWS